MSKCPVFFLSWTISLCMDRQHFGFSFICQWTLGLLPYFCCCEQCCYEHECKYLLEFLFSVLWGLSLEVKCLRISFAFNKILICLNERLSLSDWRIVKNGGFYSIFDLRNVHYFSILCCLPSLKPPRGFQERFLEYWDIPLEHASPPPGLYFLIHCLSRWPQGATTCVTVVFP